MGRIFSLLALAQIAWEWAKRMLGRLVDSLADSQPGYYGLAGEWVYIDQTDDPPALKDPQADYSASNLAAQVHGLPPQAEIMRTVYGDGYQQPDPWAVYSAALRAAQRRVTPFDGSDPDTENRIAAEDWAEIMREYRAAS